MRIRPRMLPPGWYPGARSGCESEIAGFIRGMPPLPAGTPVYGGMVPHAGWYFSGKLAAQVFHLNALAVQPQVVCIFGGHLSGASPPLLVNEDAWDTPYGAVPLATEFYAPLRAKINLKEEYPGDNTIEVNLPFAAHFFPHARVLAIRAPQSARALELGEAVAAVAQELGRTILCFGSADLTHYGLNYGFAPRGYGPQAVQWVKEVNDKRFMDRILNMDALGAIQAADEDQSSCSAGGPAAAMAAAMKLGATRALKVGYYTSYDVMPGDSVVGYGGVVWAG
jgi:MEMO1 family protein